MPGPTAGNAEHFPADPEAKTSETGPRSPNARCVPYYSTFSNLLYGHALEICEGKAKIDLVKREVGFIVVK